MSFPRYQEYKDSGVEWLGPVPVHWKVTRLKNIAYINMGQSPSSDDCTQDEVGLPFLQGNADFGENHPLPRSYCAVANKLAKSNDILFSVRAPVGAINIADQPYGIGRGLCAITASSECSMRFVFHALQVMKSELFAVATGSTYEAVSTDQVGSATCLAPPLSEQTQIAAFLDHETAKIDALVAEQRRLMELLKEKRQAVISHAVTKGLNPDVPMKPSGIEWLGDVPEHWQVKRIKHLISVLTDYTANGSFASLAENVKYLDEGYSRLVRLTDLREDLTNVGIFVDEAAHKFLAKSELFGGEVLIANVGAYAGFACLMPNNQGIATLGPNMYLINFDKKALTNSYGVLCLMSFSVQEQLKLASTSTAQPKLNKDNVKSCVTVIPPTLAEQAEILSYLGTRNHEFDALTAEAQRAIDLLQERRTALISAAVTGQIDVRSSVVA